MFKLLCLSIIRLVVLTMLLVQFTLGFNVNAVFAQETNQTPSPLTAETTETKIEANSPVKAEKTGEKPVSTPEETKKSPLNNQQVTYPEPPNEYDREAIDKFNAEFYGN